MNLKKMLALSLQAATLALGMQRLNIWTPWALKCSPQCWIWMETEPRSCRGPAHTASPSSRWTSPSHNKCNRPCWTPKPNWGSKVKTNCFFWVCSYQTNQLGLGLMDLMELPPHLSSVSGSQVRMIACSYDCGLRCNIYSLTSEMARVVFSKLYSVLEVDPKKTGMIPSLTFNIFYMVQSMFDKGQIIYWT